MKTQQYLSLVKKHTTTRHTLMEAKAKEYATNTDRFRNFNRIATTLGLSQEQTVLVYLLKHVDSISTYVQNNCHGDETEEITHRIYDVQNYCDILIAMVEEKQKEVKV